MKLVRPRFTFKTLLAIGTACAASLFFAYWVVLPKWQQYLEVQSLVDDLNDESRDVRVDAAQGLGSLGRQAQAAVPALITALRRERSRAEARRREWEQWRAANPDGMVSQHFLIPGPIEMMMVALQKIAPEVVEAQIPILLETLKTEDSVARADAADALCAMGTTAVPQLTEALGDADVKVRAGAIHVLGRISPEAKVVLPALIRALNDEHWMVRNHAASALGFSGPEAQAGVPHLVAALKDEHATVRRCAVGALGRIGGEAQAGVPALITLLNDEDVNVRWSAAVALGQIGPPAQAVVPALIAALKDEHEFVRECAARALGQIGPAAQAAVPALIAALEDEDPRVRSNAAEALSVINPKANK